MSAVLQTSAKQRWEKYRAAIGGLTEYWYPVTTAAELRRKKRQMVKVLGKKLVLFYEQNGFYALLDKCPHRGVPLSLGRFEFPGHISCIFHGWTYELKSGELAAALTDGPGSPVTRKARVQTFPVEERNGRLRLVASQDGAEGSLTIHQDTKLFAGTLRNGESIRYDLRPGRYACSARLPSSRSSAQTPTGGCSPRR